MSVSSTDGTYRWTYFYFSRIRHEACHFWIGISVRRYLERAVPDSARTAPTQVLHQRAAGEQQVQLLGEAAVHRLEVRLESRCAALDAQLEAAQMEIAQQAEHISELTVRLESSESSIVGSLPVSLAVSLEASPETLSRDASGASSRRGSRDAGNISSSNSSGNGHGAVGGGGVLNLAQLQRLSGDHHRGEDENTTTKDEEPLAAAATMGGTSLDDGDGKMASVGEDEREDEEGGSNNNPEGEDDLSETDTVLLGENRKEPHLELYPTRHTETAPAPGGGRRRLVVQGSGDHQWAQPPPSPFSPDSLVFDDHDNPTDNDNII